jgi:hypothetical protein
VGYLDKQSRVVDVILTELGRKLYSVGRLDFAYFGLFDDCIDYDPVRSSGSFSDQERRDQIEATPVLEAPFIRDVRGTVAPLEPTDHMFTAAPGFVRIPTMDAPVDGSSVSLMADQRSGGGTYRRTGTSLAQIDLDVVGETERGNPGFIVRVLSSGSNGLQPLGFRRDLSARRAADPFIAIAVDDEVPQDQPVVRSPDSSRVQSRPTPRKR